LSMKASAFLSASSCKSAWRALLRMRDAFPKSHVSRRYRAKEALYLRRSRVH
jgi:hypothetical protein